MAGISNYLADKVDDWLHGGTSFTYPSTTYFALVTAMPTASGGGTEVSGGSYVRLAVTNNSTNWPASASGLKGNGTVMSWATPSADWGVVLGVAEYDASTSGNLLTFSPLASPVTILSGQIFTMAVNAFTYTWTGDISIYLTDKLNDFLHGGGTFTVPSPTYFGLMTVQPAQATTGTETTGTGYARFSDTNNSTNWPASTGQTKANTNAFTFGTATGAWTGPEVACAEYDASSGGHILTFGPLSTPVTVGGGAAPQVPAAGAVYSVS